MDRVAQEAMTNVARHADATAVELRLERTGDQVVLTVATTAAASPGGAQVVPRDPRHARDERC